MLDGVAVSEAARLGRLYDEARAGTAGRGPAVNVADLGALLLVVLVFLVLALLRLGSRPSAQVDPGGSESSAPTGGRQERDETDRGALPARDLDEALRITGGSLDIANALLEQMLAELPAQTESLATAVACDDWEAAKEIAQGIRRGSAVCAVPALHAAVRHLQVATGDQNPGAVATALAEIDGERRRLLGPDRRLLTAPPLVGASLC
jgi:HPt (histidine-containing phosphotransfer) domain-containing protein